MKDVIIIELLSEDGRTGYAECVAMREPTYTEETVKTAWHVLLDFLLPKVNEELARVGNMSVPRFNEIGKWIRGHQMAKAGLEMAMWDLESAQTRTPLHELLGGTVRDVPVGVSLGIYDDLASLKERVQVAANEGYVRIKLKVAPGYDLAQLQCVRDVLPGIGLMADANSAYSDVDTTSIKAMDELGLMMIEQPLAYDDMVDHAQLQAQMQTPICLDESVKSAADTRRATELEACRVINLKPGRVGGFSESIRIHDLAVSSGLGLWCGGMYETGIGRLHNIALMSLPGFQLPTDVGPSQRYFVDDIVDPPIQFHHPGFLRVEPMCGVASRVDVERLNQVTVNQVTYTFSKRA